MKYRIADIIVKDRKRKAGNIVDLAKSIKQLGLLNPLTILPDGTLVAGLNRLEACKSVGWEEVDVNIVDLDALHVELAEIDENLIRNELHFLDRDEWTKRRKEIYEALHPETAIPGRGKNQYVPNEIISLGTPTFTEDTSTKTGQSKRNVELSVQRAKAFTPEQREVLKQADVSQTDATKLARLEQPKREAAVQKIATSSKKIRVKEAIAAVKRDEKIEKSKSIILPPDIQLLHGDFREIGNQIADNSVSLIFTDPPYHEQYLPLWLDLGSFAARVLKPGGMLLAYSGQTFLPRVLNALSEHLDYCWLIGQYHKGEHLQIWKCQVWNAWKPLVLFSKGKSAEHDWFIDAYDGIKGDKEAHEWAQGEDEAQYFIQKLTQPGDLVIDPMCGSGPIVRMAHRFNRRAIGIEIDKGRYDVALGSMEVEVPA